MSKRKTNEDLVVHLMNFSPYGALSQMFIIQAIQTQCSAVIKQEKELLKKDKENEHRSFVNIESWIGTAKDIDKRMKEFYKTNKL